MKSGTLPFLLYCLQNMQLQQAFPGKPIFYSETIISLSLPDKPTAEKLEVRQVLGDLNQWVHRYGYSYSGVLAKLAPEANLTNEQKQQK